MAPPGSRQNNLGPETEERRQKRKLCNRESARRSRMRKQQQVLDLTNLVAQLMQGNKRALAQIEALSQHHQGLEAENGELRAQVAELTERLQSLNSVLRFVEQLSGVAMDVPSIPDPLLKPWQPPRPAFQC
ncbi:bZIP transcription factor 53-like [Canna indica]|uniref:BZIP transcription factor 53-like n=1 Tax=Canna indica TaxID=4628 RepID=A0AAQ3QKV0_9LILI|nr:bZIP transcription factor 53-like [Canna indica]